MLAAAGALAVPAPAAANHVYAFQWGTPGTGPEQLDDPAGLDTDRFDNVYVADFGNHRVEKFSPDGELIAELGSPGVGDGQFQAPRDVTVDSTGNVYVADRIANRIQKFEPNGTFAWARDGSTGAGQFNQPSGVATDSSGNVYVTDRASNRVQKFEPDGDYVTSFGSAQMNFPTGIDVSAGGAVYVTNEGTNVVQEWTTGGVFVDDWDGSGGGNAAFANPRDVAVSAQTDKVFVVDDEGNSVEQFDLSGAYEFKWDAAGAGDGEFDTPLAVATASLDRFFVSDLGNGRIQRFDAPTTGSIVRTSGTRLVFEADTGAANDVLVEESGGGTYTVTDTGDSLTGGGGCSVLAGEATCNSSTTITSIRATTLDDDDSFEVDGTTPGLLDGGADNDTLLGGDGNDTLTGGPGNDTLTGAGGTGDVVSYSGAGVGVTVDLSDLGAQPTVGAGTDTISNTVEGVTGSAHEDTLTGSGPANTLNGGAGDDDLNGGAGNDTLNGGADDDTVNGGADDDTVNGGDGTDTVSYAGAGGAVIVTLGSSAAQPTGGSGTDTLGGFENLTGSGHGDTLTGDGGVNSIEGAAGSDSITINDTSADSADCGADTDTVTADLSDTVTNCETVTRVDASAPGDGGGGGGGGTGGGGGAPGGGGVVAPAPSPPVLSGLAVTRMRSGKPGTFSYSLNKAAGVTITIERAQRGRKVGRTCRKQTRKNRKKRACTLFKAVGKLSRASVAGRNALRFSGKLAGRKLAAGVYRATAVATSAAGRSNPVTAKFAVRR